VSGDVDAHVTVPAEDLRGTYRYTEIVEVLRAAGHDEEAELESTGFRSQQGISGLPRGVSAVRVPAP
jgi:hypothetical protein